MCTLANSEDTDEIPRMATFHRGMPCLVRHNRSPEKEIQYFSESITFDPSIHIMGHHDSTVSN